MRPEGVGLCAQASLDNLREWAHACQNDPEIVPKLPRFLGPKSKDLDVLGRFGWGGFGGVPGVVPDKSGRDLGYLDRSWSVRYPGAVEGGLGPSWGRLGALAGRLGAILGPH